MTDVSRQDLRNSLIYVLPPVISSAVPLLTLPLITRAVTSEEYGAWALAVAYAQFVSGVANFGLTISYERNFFQFRESKSEAALLYSVLSFVASTFAIAGAATMAARPAIAMFLMHTKRYASVLVWAFCAQAVTSLRTYFLIYFRNTTNARAYALYSIDENLLSAVFSVVLVVVLKMGPDGLAIGPLLGSSLVFLALMWRFLRQLPPAWDWNLLRDTLRISYPLTPRIFFGGIGGSIDKYLIGLLGSMGGVGVYSIAQRVSHVSFTFTTALENVFVPQVYRRMFERTDNGIEVGRYLTPFAFVSAAATLVIVLAAPEAIRFFTTSGEFLGAVPVVAVLGLHYGVMFFGKIPQLMYGKKTWFISVLSLMTIGLNGAFGVAIIPRLGAVGAALAALLTGVVTNAITLHAGQKAYRIQWELGKLASIYALLTAAAGIIIIGPALAGGRWIFVGLRIAVLLAFMWLGWRIGVISRDAVSRVRSFIGDCFRAAGT